ncbi:MAG: TonB family protein [Rhodocyclales bacterium]|nr:TonB family protein [Rhodocyclales bacterium]
MTVDFLSNSSRAISEDRLRQSAVPPGIEGASLRSESQPPENVSAPAGTLPPAPAASSLSTQMVSGLLPGPWYYAARYLHRRPTPLKPIRPNYPPEAENLRGQVMLLLLINERGTVDTYHIVESQPPGVFDDAVSDAFTREQYAPGLITGYPVKSQLLVDVTFEPGSAPTAIILPGPSR